RGRERVDGRAGGTRARPHADARRGRLRGSGARNRRRRRTLVGAADHPRPPPRRRRTPDIVRQRGRPRVARGAVLGAHRQRAEHGHGGSRRRGAIRGMTTGATTRRAAFDLQAAARRDMHDNGFTPDLPADAAHQLADIAAHPAPNDTTGRRDLRALLWSSIDNDDTRDFEPLDGDTVRLRVAIADVDALLPAGTPLDRAAAANATSVYLGVHTFTMIPETLCYDLTSLRADVDRRAVVIEADIAADGTIARNDVYPAIVRNRAQLAYPSLGAWLEGRGAAPAPVAANRALADQLQAQHALAQRLRTQRQAHGALELEMIEATPV